MAEISRALRWTFPFLSAALLLVACSDDDGGGQGSGTPSPFDSATSLAAAIQAGDISSAELLELYLARVDALNPEINAIAAEDVAAARARAQEADEALARGESWGPLHGVPFTVKDTMNVAGMPTTIGSPDYADFIPEENAAGVQRLIDAGAIVFGKTNTPAFAGDWQTYNEVYGTTNNPWDLTRTPGGSSGGSAAALAAGLTGFELGGDIGGSLRVPAHNTGVYSHHPTFGLIPMDGHFSRFAVPAPPDPPGLIFGVIGPMARSAADLDLLLGILAEPEGGSLAPPREDALTNYRVGAWLSDPALETDVEVLTVLEDLVQQLRDAGVTVDTVAPLEDLEQLALDHRLLRFAITRGVMIPPDELEALLTERERIQAQWASFFEEYDVLLAPCAPLTAIEHDQEGLPISRSIVVNGEEISYQNFDVWPAVAGYAGLPATTAPVGIGSSGLPVGVQVIGPVMEDRTTIHFAAKLEELIGGFQPPPSTPAEM